MLGEPSRGRSAKIAPREASRNQDAALPLDQAVEMADRVFAQHMT